MTPSTYMNDCECQLHFLGNLPSHWQQLRLKHLVRVFGGGTPSKERGDFWEGTIPWVSPRDMKRLRIEKTLHNISVEAKQSANLPDVPKESVLLVTRGMILAHSFPVAIAGDTVTINQDMKALAPREQIEPAYLASLLAAIKPIAFEYVDSAAHGTKRLDWEKFRNVVLPVPPLPEQHAITDFLDHETARIDALIEEQKRLISLLREKRQASTARLITQGRNSNVSFKESGIEWIGRTPSHWETGRVGWWFQVDLGKMLDESRITGDHLAPYIRNTDVQWDWINISELPEMDFAPSERIRYRLAYGDLLVCEGGEIGRSAIWPYKDFECYYQKALHRVRTLGKGNSDFLSWILRYLAEGGILDGSATSSTINHLTRDQLRRLVIALPPRDEQSEIVESLRDMHEEFLRLEREAEKLIETLTERRAALISAAVTGKIDVREWDRSTPSTEEALPHAAEKEGRYG